MFSCWHIKRRCKKSFVILPCYIINESWWEILFNIAQPTFVISADTASWSLYRALTMVYDLLTQSFLDFVHRLIFNKARRFGKSALPPCSAIFLLLPLDYICSQVNILASSQIYGAHWVRTALSKGSTRVGAFFAWRRKQSRLPKRRDPLQMRRWTTPPPPKKKLESVILYSLSNVNNICKWTVSQNTQTVSKTHSSVYRAIPQKTTSTYKSTTLQILWPCTVVTEHVI
jgi:hypothetical protein